MVFMVEPLSISAAITRLPHSVDGKPTLDAYCGYVVYFTDWYHLYRFPLVRFDAGQAEAADFVLGNRANDTDDTKPSSRDTPTIHGITTMTSAGVFDVDFAAATVP